MFNKIIDVIQLKHLEKSIGRELTIDDLQQFDPPIFSVQIEDGEPLLEEIKHYSLTELMPGNLTEADLDNFSAQEYNNIQANLPKLKKVRPSGDLSAEERKAFYEEITIGNQEFNPQNAEHLHAVGECLLEIERQELLFEKIQSGYEVNNTEKWILKLYSEGFSAHSISRWLIAQHESHKDYFQKLGNLSKMKKKHSAYLRDGLEPYSHATVSRKIIKLLRVLLLLSRRKRLPITGTRDKKGTPVVLLCFFSRVKPPRITVPPFLTCRAVTSLRVSNSGGV